MKAANTILREGYLVKKEKYDKLAEFNEQNEENFKKLEGEYNAMKAFCLYLMRQQEGSNSLEDQDLQYKINNFKDQGGPGIF